MCLVGKETGKSKNILAMIFIKIKNFCKKKRKYNSVRVKKPYLKFCGIKQ